MSTTQQTEPRRNTLLLAIRSHSRAALVLAAAVVFQLAFIASFTGAMSRPALRDATVGLVAALVMAITGEVSAQAARAGRGYDGLGWLPGRAHSLSRRSSVLAMLSIQTLPLSIPARSSSGAREQS
jgi:hypothetical protein